jgi:hypothetical protein
VISDQASSAKPAAARCRKCRKPIELPGDDDVLDKFGVFFRLRCTAAGCGHVDWYKGVVTPPPTASAQVSQEPGEVWIHDVILGLPFKADAHEGHDIG